MQVSSPNSHSPSWLLGKDQSLLAYVTVFLLERGDFSIHDSQSLHPSPIIVKVTGGLPCAMFPSVSLVFVTPSGGQRRAAFTPNCVWMLAALH